MNYTLPELEGLAEALNEINSYDENEQEEVTGVEAINSLKGFGLL